jgi:membrane protease YdiL (CAAX protease family)
MTAGFIIVSWENGSKGARSFLKSIFRLPDKPFYLVVALVTPFILFLLAVLLNHFFNASAISFIGLGEWNEIIGLSTIGFAAVSFFVFGLGEEAGWRGIAVPELQNKFNALTTSILFTFCWALWHWPLFFYKKSGYYNMNFAAMIGWFFSLLAGSVILTWLFNASGGNILVCAIFHATIDIVFTSNIPEKNIANYIVLLTVLWAIAIIIIYKPKNLAKTHRIQNSQATNYG